MTTAPPSNPDLLTREQAAEYLGVSKNTLEVWATTKRYPLPYTKIGRCVRYRRRDLDRFIEDRMVNVTR